MFLLTWWILSHTVLRHWCLLFPLPIMLFPLIVSCFRVFLSFRSNVISFFFFFSEVRHPAHARSQRTKDLSAARIRTRCPALHPPSPAASAQMSFQRRFLYASSKVDHYHPQSFYMIDSICQLSPLFEITHLFIYHPSPFLK